VLSGPEDCGNCGLDIEDDEVMDEYLFMLGFLGARRCGSAMRWMGGRQ